MSCTLSDSLEGTAEIESKCETIIYRAWQISFCVRQSYRNVIYNVIVMSVAATREQACTTVVENFESYPENSIRPRFSSTEVVHIAVVWCCWHSHIG